MGGGGVNIFQGGGGWVQLVLGEGVQFLTSIEIYRTNDFQRGGGGVRTLFPTTSGPTHVHIGSGPTFHEENDHHTKPFFVSAAAEVLI